VPDIAGPCRLVGRLAVAAALNSDERILDGERMGRAESVRKVGPSRCERSRGRVTKAVEEEPGRVREPASGRGRLSMVNQGRMVDEFLSEALHVL
jgi:hypothetical protein